MYLGFRSLFFGIKRTVTVEELQPVMNPVVRLFPRRFLLK